MKIKKGDTVEVIAGKDRGKRGAVLRVAPKDNRLVVQGLNLRKKHQRARPAGAGGRQLAPEILTFEGPMDAANVMIICPKCGERVRVGYQRDEDGSVSRICKQCEEALDG